MATHDGGLAAVQAATAAHDLAAAGARAAAAAAADADADRQQQRLEEEEQQYEEEEDDAQQQGRISYDAAAGSEGGMFNELGVPSALLGRKHAPDRRPLRFWQPFNDWWRSELNRLGRRPTSEEIGEW
jgi:hypothetical protein